MSLLQPGAGQWIRRHNCFVHHHPSAPKKCPKRPAVDPVQLSAVKKKLFTDPSPQALEPVDVQSAMNPIQLAGAGQSSIHQWGRRHSGFVHHHPSTMITKYLDPISNGPRLGPRQSLKRPVVDPVQLSAVRKKLFTDPSPPSLEPAHFQSVMSSIQPAVAGQSSIHQWGRRHSGFVQHHPSTLILDPISNESGTRQSLKRPARLKRPAPDLLLPEPQSDMRSVQPANAGQSLIHQFGHTGLVNHHPSTDITKYMAPSNTPKRQAVDSVQWFASNVILGGEINQNGPVNWKPEPAYPTSPPQEGAAQPHSRCTVTFDMEGEDHFTTIKRVPTYNNLYGIIWE